VKAKEWKDKLSSGASNTGLETENSISPNIKSLLPRQSFPPIVPYITQCGSTVYIGMPKSLGINPVHLKIRVFTFNRHFI